MSTARRSLHEYPRYGVEHELMTHGAFRFEHLLDRVLLADSADVCLSWALPQAFAFSAILFLVALVGADSYTRSFTSLSYESTPGVPTFRTIVCRCFRLVLYAGLLLE
jgi:hypothetical protein